MSHVYFSPSSPLAESQALDTRDLEIGFAVLLTQRKVFLCGHDEITN